MNVVFFDGVCNLCNKTVQFILKNEVNNDLYFSPLQSDFAKKTLKNFNQNNLDLKSIYFFTDGKLYSKSTAALKIAQRLRFPYKILFALIIIPKFIRDFIYIHIAKHRYNWFGKKNTCMIPSKNLNHRFLK